MSAFAGAGIGYLFGIITAFACVLIWWKLKARTHRYLSTGCLHGKHGYCQGKEGQAGTKKPAQCKFCAAPCICECHYATFDQRVVSLSDALHKEKPAA